MDQFVPNSGNHALERMTRFWSKYNRDHNNDTGERELQLGGTIGEAGVSFSEKTN